MNNPNRGFDGHISACPLLKSSRTRQGSLWFCRDQTKICSGKTPKDWKCARFREEFGAESAGRLAPAKIDKPRIAEILPFTAGSDLFSVGYPIISLTDNWIKHKKQNKNFFDLDVTILVPPLENRIKI